MIAAKDIHWRSKAWGRESDLLRLHTLFNDDTKGPKTRLGAKRAYQKIQKQLSDPKYTSLRESLIKATKDGNHKYVRKYELQIRDYLHEEKLSFTLEDD